jgi:hypothetical protein
MKYTFRPTEGLERYAIIDFLIEKNMVFDREKLETIIDNTLGFSDPFTIHAVIGAMLREHILANGKGDEIVFVLGEAILEAIAKHHLASLDLLETAMAKTGCDYMAVWAAISVLDGRGVIYQGNREEWYIRRD